ncbi:SRPBCC family protein [Micromonospora sp. NPDC049559]|uniref:SRPBCC family protein n=1 Tax=Micromonospora sp. NPDC049559 TaxID=3155923 RepID=UPI003444294F
MPRTTTESRPIRELLAERIGGELRNLAGAAGERLVSTATARIGSATSRLTEYADGGGPGRAAAAAGARKLAEGRSPARAGLSAGLAAGKEQLKAALGKGGGGSNKVKVTNIVESIDVGVPVRVAYNQWTRYEDFPRFTKKVEHVERTSDEKLTWKAQVFWSHRSWEATVLEQVPDERIVWRSSGKKGHVDGTVTFHALTPSLTRILLVLEYHPQGLFERTGNLWRAQGRRARLELKHFARHVMTQSILRPDEIEGSRVEIRDGRVVRRDEPGPKRGRGSGQDQDQERGTGERARTNRKGRR